MIISERGMPKPEDLTHTKSGAIFVNYDRWFNHVTVEHAYSIQFTKLNVLFAQSVCVFTIEQWLFFFLLQILRAGIADGCWLLMTVKNEILPLDRTSPFMCIAMMANL